MSVFLSGLEELAERFDAFLIDQFGVLMQGDAAYPFAPAALQKLSSMGKRIIVLSNSGKRAISNNDRLVINGFSRDHFETVLSSGEIAYHFLTGCIGETIPKNTKVLVLSRDNDVAPIEGLPLQVTEKAHEAGLVLLAGSQGDIHTIDHYQTLLQNPASRDVPCLCTNPDMTMLTAQGLRFGAGKIAKLYEDLGGRVEWIGKPYPMIYKAALELLGDTAQDAVICIGDSPAHDIIGGALAGFKTTLVRTGIHAQDTDETLISECAKIGAKPDFVLPQFSFTHLG